MKREVADRDARGVGGAGFGSAWCWPWPSSASRPTPRACAHRSRQAVGSALYAGLVALALWWAAACELLNGFDAALWLLCFFAIEGNILEYEHAEPTLRG